MKFPIRVIALTTLLMLHGLNVHQGYSWGFFAHKRINEMAVFTLPPDMIGFYKRNVIFVSEHAVDPDRRRGVVLEEHPRHFIDADRYGKDPFNNIPRKWDDAVAKFTKDTLIENGIVPWHVVEVLNKLTFAFKEGNLDRILKLSADLGHYIGDAHVPLHTTENYNGQMTGQRGIHGFWESRIPELKAENYDYLVGRAKYIKDPLEYIWQVVEQSFAAKDSVLLFEAQLTKTFPSDRKYAFENRGEGALVKTYSEEFSNAYDQMLSGMVERRMRESIIAVGSFWYTAWVNAGKPDLQKFYDKTISSEMQMELAEQELDFKSKDKKPSVRDCAH